LFACLLACMPSCLHENYGTKAHESCGIYAQNKVDSKGLNRKPDNARVAMNTLEGSTTTALRAPHKAKWRRPFIALAAVVLIAAMAYDTTVVPVGGDKDLREQAFDPDTFGQNEFPRIRDHVMGIAPDAVQLASELAEDKNAALEAYGIAGTFPVLTVRFTGVLGESKSGIYDVTVEGLPDGAGIRVQTGPAINGTELRDITGDIVFGEFKNQIEYQDAGAGINREMSAQLLSRHSG